MDYSFIAGTILFRSVSEEDIRKMSSCLHFRSRAYRRGETILCSGTVVTDLGLVLSGSIRLENTDIWGNKSILSISLPGETFAEGYACLPDQPLPADVVANEDCEVLFVNVAHVLNPCERPCLCHSKLINNLVALCAQQMVSLSSRIFDTASKTIRGRLISYFSRVALQQNSSTITIPFDRQQLADYLSVDRSAMSRELGKMKEEGLLDFDRSRKNSFVCRLPQLAL